MFRKKQTAYNLRIKGESLNLNKINILHQYVHEIMLNFSQNGSKYTMIYVQDNKKPYIHLLGFLGNNQNSFSEIESIISFENNEKEPEIYAKTEEKTILSKVINLKEKFTLEQLSNIFEKYREHLPNIKISTINLHNIPESIFTTLPEYVYQKIKKLKFHF